MAPYTTSVNDQKIITLYDDDTCPISEEDLFKDYKTDETVVEVQNSKFYVPNHEEDLIQKCIHGSKEYFEKDFLEKVDKYLPKNAIILDIGANIGNHTLYWANESKAKKIYSFEPIPHTFSILKKNIEINNLQDKVALFNIGLADENGKAEIKSFCKQNLGGTRLKKLQSNTNLQIDIKMLDSINIEEKQIDLIKIDVEGMDNEVLTGAKKTLKKHKPSLILIESFPDSFEKSNEILTTLGYKMESSLGNFEYLYTNKI